MSSPKAKRTRGGPLREYALFENDHRESHQDEHDREDNYDHVIGLSSVIDLAFQGRPQLAEPLLDEPGPEARFINVVHGSPLNQIDSNSIKKDRRCQLADLGSCKCFALEYFFKVCQILTVSKYYLYF